MYVCIGKKPVEIGRPSTHGMWGGASNGYKTLEQMDLRLDTSIFRCMFASSIYAARELVAAGSVYVNEKKCTVSDTRLDPGDMIEIRDCARVHANLQDTEIKPFMRMWAHVPAYWDVNYATCSAVLLHRPRFDMIPTPYHDRVLRHFLEFYHKLW